MLQSPIKQKHFLQASSFKVGGASQWHRLANSANRCAKLRNMKWNFAYDFKYFQRVCTCAQGCVYVLLLL